MPEPIIIDCQDRHNQRVTCRKCGVRIVVSVPEVDTLFKCYHCGTTTTKLAESNQ